RNGDKNDKEDDVARGRARIMDRNVRSAFIAMCWAIDGFEILHHSVLSISVVQRFPDIFHGRRIIVHEIGSSNAQNHTGQAQARTTLEAPRPRISRYIAGTKISVANVAKTSPPMTARPSGAFCSPPSPIPRAMGIMPRTMAPAVISTGRRRV